MDKTKKESRSKVPEGDSSISFYLPKEAHDALRVAANRLGGASVAAIARKAINDFLAKEQIAQSKSS